METEEVDWGFETLSIRIGTEVLYHTKQASAASAASAVFKINAFAFEDHLCNDM